MRQPEEQLGVDRLPPGRFFGQRSAEQQVGRFRIGRFVPTVPAEELKVHTHEEAHFVYVRSGRYLSSAKGAPDVCDGSQLIFNPPGTTHRDRFHSLEQASFLTIAFPAQTLPGFEGELPEHPVCFPSTPLYGCLLRLDVELSRWHAASGLVAESACLELIEGLGRCAAPAHRREPVWFKKVRERLDDDEVRSISSVAEEAGIHPVHLARTFREFMRCSPGEYVRQRRMMKAVELLGGNSFSIADVASESGFVDQSHLSNEFKRRVGVSPKVYRKLHQSADVSVLQDLSQNS